MKVLFICKSNQFRSQMAAALYNKITKTTDAYSAGTYVGSQNEPEGREIGGLFSSDDFFDLMEQNNMNIRKCKTVKLSPDMVVNTDIVVAMPEEPFVPDFLQADDKVIWWKIENPSIATREVSEKTFTQIKKLVEELVLDINSRK